MTIRRRGRKSHRPDHSSARSRRALRSLFFLFGLGAAAALAAGPKNEDCLSCHEDRGLTREKGGSVFVDAKVFEASVHGQSGVACVDCHSDLAKAADFPHAEHLASVNCGSCHEEASRKFANSVHAGLIGKSGQRRAGCVDCHGSHGVLPASDPASSVNHFNVAGTCLKCHRSPAIDRAAGGHGDNRPVNFQDSIHGQALLKSGLNVAPACVTCHGFHDILPPESADSTVSRAKIPATCGSCHSRILAEFDEGVHGQALSRHDPRAPVCTNCHTAHEVKRADIPAWKLSVIRECGTCHEKLIESYRDTYHGQVTALGFTRIAACSDCHGAHRIFGPRDPRSSVSSANIVATCGKCHPGTGTNFAKYDPHADPKDRKRNPLLHYAALLMKGLLVGVFSFFGIHTLLWFPRSAAARRENGRPRPEEKK
jgi:nitrate/TMAO reductase-like tetraheme cytochrome c subunit